MQILIYAMVYLGSALMVYNIYGFIRFARYVKELKSWDNNSYILYVPIFLLVFFLTGYLVIGLFGKPDLMMAGVLFGGSIFVQIMYRLLNRIVREVVMSEQLKAELLAAEESSRAKSSFLAGISHEMRTPMNVILGMDALALKNPSLPDETRDQLEKIGYSAHHLSSLINNLLDLQETGKDKSVSGAQMLSLKEAMDQINAVYSACCSEKGLEFRYTGSPEAEEAYAGDAFELKRALMNILDNAVKFTDAPGTVRFLLEAETQGEEGSVLHFTIEDTGVGIDPAFLPKIFDAFAQEDQSATSRFSGSGVGLTAACSIISGMGGKIEAKSQKNEGSTFLVTIPMIAAPVRESTITPEVSAEDHYEPEEVLEGCRILVVDDIDDNAEIVSDLLEIAGAESDRAENGQIAVDMFAGSAVGAYDAVLMDLRMPVMDGLEATRRIRALDRKDAKNVPIIALSANAYDSDVQNSLKAGMNSHLAKPADADLLYAELAGWIRKTSGEEAKNSND